MLSATAFYGALLMLLNTVAFSVIDAITKVLSSNHGLSSADIVFYYKLLLLVAMVPWVLKNGFAGLKTEKIYHHLLRSLLSVLASLCFIQGLKYVPMSDAAAFENIQYVVLSIVGIVFFHEKFNIVKLIAMSLGFFGIIIIINPDLLNNPQKIFSNLHLYSFTLAAVGFWSLNSIIIKILGKTERNYTQMFYLLLFAVIWSAPFALIKWEPTTVFGLNLSLLPSEFIGLSDVHITFEMFVLIAALSACYFIHAVAYFRALKYELSVVIPLRYTKIFFNTILGVLLFQEVPKMESTLGYVMIVFSGLLIVLAEIKKAIKTKKRAAATPVVTIKTQLVS